MEGALKALDVQFGFQSSISLTNLPNELLINDADVELSQNGYLVSLQI
ncbi:hypothetical protein JQC92_11380 [Shewanella sp. 202IG2-18]|nr:hypothetical protein [Parashewanella hymeniacidonis]MBM7072622.1 hypothetical protein [Parashewanella hymeniacidonis]